jgi:recombination protein RecR
MRYPEIIQNLINNFASLPGLGQKAAERLVFYLLKNNKIDLTNFGNNLINIKNKIKTCPRCYNYMDNNQCLICDDNTRDKTTLCIVAEAQDIFYLDKAHSYHGLYYVLQGLLTPAEGITPDKLTVDNLIKKLSQEPINEVVMGFNPTVEGESTILYLKKIIKENFPKIKITRLSRGLPMGGDLEYADEITLSSAIKNRNEI